MVLVSPSIGEAARPAPVSKASRDAIHAALAPAMAKETSYLDRTFAPGALKTRIGGTVGGHRIVRVTGTDNAGGTWRGFAVANYLGGLGTERSPSRFSVAEVHISPEANVFGSK